jgi:hypothetical protein
MTTTLPASQSATLPCVLRMCPGTKLGWVQPGATDQPVPDLAFLFPRKFRFPRPRRAKKLHRVAPCPGISQGFVCKLGQGCTAFAPPGRGPLGATASFLGATSESLHRTHYASGVL